MEQAFFRFKMYLDLTNKETNIDGSYAVLDDFIDRIRYIHNQLVGFVNSKLGYLEQNRQYSIINKLLFDNLNNINATSPLLRNVLYLEYRQIIADAGFGYLLKGKYVSKDGVKPLSLTTQFSKYCKTKEINIHSCNSFIEAIEKYSLNPALNKYFYGKGKHINPKPEYLYGVKNRGFSSTSEQIHLCDNNLDSIQIWNRNPEFFKIRHSKKLPNGKYKDELEQLVIESLQDGKIKAKSCAIRREYFGRKVRYSIVFIMEGEKPLTSKQKEKKEICSGVCGIDLGPKTIAIHFNNETEDILTLNNQNVLYYQKKIDKISGKIRRLVSNYNNHQEELSEKDIEKYKRLSNALYSTFRKKNASTIAYQNELAHYIHQHASSVVIENANFKKLMNKKRYTTKRGRKKKTSIFHNSIIHYCPGKLYAQIRNIGERYQHDFNVVEPTYCASQYDIFGNKVKKTLAERVIYLEKDNKIYAIQRDLFSAYLLSHPSYNYTLPDFETLITDFDDFVIKHQHCICDNLALKWEERNTLIMQNRNNQLTTTQRERLKELQESIPTSYGLEELLER